MKLTAINLSDGYTQVLEKPLRNYKKIIEIVIKILSLGFLLAASIVMYITFALAYFHPSKSVKIFINKYGEANFEFWLISILMFISIFYLWSLLKKEKVNYNQAD